MSTKVEYKKMNHTSIDLRPSDLTPEEIDLVLDIELMFNPKTKKWDGEYIDAKIKYFINDDGILAIPLGEIKSIELNNVGLTCLKNFPTKIRYDLIVTNNKITSLEGCPSEIGGSLDCSNNEITTLKDLPATLTVQSLKMDNNKLTDLIGCPGVVEKIHVSMNPLTSLKGMPKQITNQHGVYVDLRIDALKTRLKNLAYMTATTYNITSLYKISDLEHDFVQMKKILIDESSADRSDKNVIMGVYDSEMNEKDYFLALADYIVKAKKEDRAEEIWWDEEVRPNLSNLFKSVKTVNKFNL